jgi:hypothetical protein
MPYIDFNYFFVTIMHIITLTYRKIMAFNMRTIYMFALLSSFCLVVPALHAAEDTASKLAQIEQWNQDIATYQRCLIKISETKKIEEIGEREATIDQLNRFIAEKQQEVVALQATLPPAFTSQPASEESTPR